jgi:hypothetical protein
MTDNHNHAVEEVLAGTVPQARPEFQQALEEQLMLAIQERTQLEIKPMNMHDRDSKPKRMPRGLSVTLAATFAMILFGGLAALIGSGSLANAPMFSGAAQNQQADSIPQDIASTATSIILQATYQAAEAQLMTSQAQLDAVARQATEQAAAANPDQAMTSVVQTATAVVEQATARASGDLFLTPLPPSHHTATAVIQGATAEAAVIWTATGLAEIDSVQADLVPSLVPTAAPIGSAFADAVPQTCPPEKLVVYTAPGAHNLVLTSIDPLAAEKYQVQGILTLHETGEDWFYVAFAYEGEEVHGWVQADSIRVACQNGTSSVIVGNTAITLLPPMVTPTYSPTPTPTMWPSVAAGSLADTATATPTITATPIASAPEPVVEQMDDGSYRITLPIAEEPAAEINPGDAVYVLAEMRYGTDGRAWTVVAQDMQVIALLESSRAGDNFRWMDVVLMSVDEETVSLLQDMAAAGVAFSLERTP